jgi:hypothetical protein
MYTPQLLCTRLHSHQRRTQMHCYQSARSQEGSISLVAGRETQQPKTDYGSSQEKIIVLIIRLSLRIMLQSMSARRQTERSKCHLCTSSPSSRHRKEHDMLNASASLTLCSSSPIVSSLEATAARIMTSLVSTMRSLSGVDRHLPSNLSLGISHLAQS